MKEYQGTYSNIFYVQHFNIIGGIETYIYELVKKYKDYDITIAYSDTGSDKKQLARIRKYARVIYVPYNSKEKIKCKKLFIMYGGNIDLFDAEEIVHIIHADYKAQNLKANLDERINERYGVSKSVAKTYEEISNKETKVCYNPISKDTPKKILKLISATRLTKEKGKDRMIKLGEELNRSGIPYIWLVFTNDTKEIQNENIVYMKPRLDIKNFIQEADYLVQLSDTEAWCYSVLESLCLKTPVLITPIASFEEMGIKNGINGYILPFDMKDIPINDIYNKIPKISNFEPPKDIYDKLLIKNKSTYVPDKLVFIKAIKSFYDIEEGKYKTTSSEPWEVPLYRAEELMNNQNGKLVEICK